MIGDFGIGKLGAARAGELLNHIENCPACSAEFDLVADLVTQTTSGESAAPPLVRPLVRKAPFGWPALALAASLLLALLPSDETGIGESSSLREIADLRPMPVLSGILRTARSANAYAGFEAAMEDFKERRFASAADGLSKVAAETSLEPIPFLYLGISLLQIGRIREARNPLEKASAIGEGLIAERALWYLGNAHLALGEGESARGIFERLAARKGDYELNALEKLRQISDAMKK